MYELRFLKSHLAAEGACAGQSGQLGRGGCRVSPAPLSARPHAALLMRDELRSCRPGCWEPRQDPDERTQAYEAPPGPQAPEAVLSFKLDLALSWKLFQIQKGDGAMGKKLLQEPSRLLLYLFIF